MGRRISCTRALSPHPEPPSSCVPSEGELMVPPPPGRLRRALRTRAALAAGALLAVGAGYLAITTLSAQAAATPLSQGKPATASSTQNAGTPPSAAVAGNARPPAASPSTDPHWM